ncbi:MAG TPA: hypothetical protein VHF89_09800 [Solirubrobacteraceae bacterium]|nr:hypothetical protein [Solirubrobacteraceae bacterium]
MRRLALILSVVAATAAGVAAASAITAPDETAPTGPRSLDPDGRPAVHALADDPDGGPRWGVRLYRTREGLTCPNAGRVEDGRFGRVGARGEHIPLPPSADGACADLATAPLALAIHRYPNRPGQRERGVVFGAVSERVSSLRYRSPTADRVLPTTRDGAFLAVEPDARMRDATLIVETGDGRTKTYRLDR